MLTTRAAVPSLVSGVSDLGMVGKITTEELQLYQRYKNRDPLEIIIATGSYNVSGWQPGFGIVVSKDNPLTKITMEQLDYIFGAERRGGGGRSSMGFGGLQRGLNDDLKKDRYGIAYVSQPVGANLPKECKVLELA